MGPGFVWRKVLKLDCCSGQSGKEVLLDAQIARIFPKKIRFWWSKSL